MEAKNNWNEKMKLRGKFVGRAKYYLITNSNARQKLAKAFGQSIEKASAEEISYLFEVLTDEIYMEDHLSSNGKMNIYFFVLTMMAYHWKELEHDKTVGMEFVLKKMYANGTNSTKKKIRVLLGESFGESFQSKLTMLVKQNKDMLYIDYFKLLNDLCSWNYSNEQMNKTIVNWSKTIFLNSNKEDL